MAKIDRVQEVALVELKPYSKNAKKHSDNQIEMIAKSISEFGFLSPILIDMDNNVIAGHGRLQAAARLELETVPCVYVEGLTEDQYKAYILADNKLTEFGEWDVDLLNSELDDIQLNMDDFGFGDLNIDFSYSSEFDYSENDDEDDEDDNDEKPRGYSITYELAFNSEEEQEEWYQILGDLKRKLPELYTISERVLEALREWNNG